VTPLGAVIRDAIAGALGTAAAFKVLSGR